MDEPRAFRILQLLVASNDYISEVFDHTGGYEDEMNFIDNRDGINYKIYRKEDEICFDGYDTYDTESEFLYLTGYIHEIESAEELLSNCTFLGCKLCGLLSTYYFKKYGEIYELLIDSDLIMCVSYMNDECSNDGCLEYHDKFRKSTNTSTCAFDDFVNVIRHTVRTKSARISFNFSDTREQDISEKIDFLLLYMAKPLVIFDFMNCFYMKDNNFRGSDKKTNCIVHQVTRVNSTGIGLVFHHRDYLIYRFIRFIILKNLQRKLKKCTMNYLQI